MLGGNVPELIETEPYSGVANYSRTICRGSLTSPQAGKTRMPQVTVRRPLRELDLSHELRMPLSFVGVWGHAVYPTITDLSGPTLPRLAMKRGIARNFR
jgi:hypothetical protein